MLPLSAVPKVGGSSSYLQPIPFSFPDCEALQFLPNMGKEEEFFTTDDAPTQAAAAVAVAHPVPLGEMAAVRQQYPQQEAAAAGVPTTTTITDRNDPIRNSLSPTMTMMPDPQQQPTSVAFHWNNQQSFQAGPTTSESMQRPTHSPMSSFRSLTKWHLHRGMRRGSMVARRLVYDTTVLYVEHYKEPGSGGHQQCTHRTRTDCQ